MILAALLLVAAVVAPAASRAASPGQLTVENNSRMDIVELYPSDPNTGSWGRELLAGQALGYGDRVEIAVAAGLKMLDLRAVFANGSEQTYYGLDVQKFSRVRLNAADMEPLE
jgi:hypothetical protein